MGRTLSVLVRCLGFGKEHYFMSSDPKTNRVCPKCSLKMSKMSPPNVFVSQRTLDGGRQ